MRILVAASLIAAQAVSVAAPAQAAELNVGGQQGETRFGAFAGARVRIALGGEKRERVRAGLAVAPSSLRTEGAATRLRIAEGVEYGLTERRAPGLSVAGMRMSDMGRAAGGDRQNVSTTGWIAIGVATVVVIGVGVLGWLVHEASQNTE
ncbi:MAG TPA: hypothetical protein VGB48_02060 [Allosphingosinicella sp.]